MGKTRIQNAISGLVTGVVNKAVMLIFPILIRLVMIRTIGIEFLGLNSLFASILGVLSISELGFSNAIVYSMYKPIAEHDTDKVNALLKFYRKVYRVIGAIIGIVGLVIVPFLDVLIAGNVAVDINIVALYLIYLGNAVIGYLLFAYKSSLLSAVQRVDIQNSIAIKISLIQNIIQILILIFIKNYYLYVIVFPVCSLLYNFMSSHYVSREFPEYHCEGELDRAEVKELFKKVGALIGNKVNATIIMSADNLVISAFLGITVVAIYNNYYTIIISLVSVVAIFVNSLLPSIGNSLVLETKEKNYNDYLTITMIMAWVSGWCGVCLLCLFQPFVTLYYGTEYLLPITTIVLFASYFYIWKMLDVQTLYRDAAGLWWSDRYRPYIVSILNIITNILLVKIIGLNGVVISTVVAQLFVSLPWLIHALHKECFCVKSRKYISKLLYYTIVIMMAAGITFLVCNFIKTTHHFLDLFLKTIICCILPNVIIVIGFYKCKEFKRVCELINKILKQKIGNEKGKGTVHTPNGG